MFDDVPDADWRLLQEHTNPALVVLQFQATPCLHRQRRCERYAQKVTDIRHIKPNGRGAHPVIGPSDMGENLNTYRACSAVTALQNTACSMPCIGTFKPSWVDQVHGDGGPALGWDDHVHFSVRGAQEAAQRLLQALAHERAVWANQRVQPAKLMAP